MRQVKTYLKLTVYGHNLHLSNLQWFYGDQKCIYGYIEESCFGYIWHNSRCSL